MSANATLPAALTYLLPVIGWLYVYFTQRQNPLAVYHLKQSIGLFLFLIGSVVVWAVVAWILALIPILSAVSLP